MIQQLIRMSILHTLRHNPSRENHSSPYHNYDHHRICQKITICYVSYCMTYAVWVIYYGKIGQCRGHLWLLYEVQSDANESPISSNILESFYSQGWFNMTSNDLKWPRTTKNICHPTHMCLALRRHHQLKLNHCNRNSMHISQSLLPKLLNHLLVSHHLKLA